MSETIERVAKAILPPIKTYSIAVEGFSPQRYSARSPGKARAAAWRDYSCAWDVSFRRFLEVSSVVRILNPPGVGDRILVGGVPATRALGRGDQYVWFMRDDSDVLLCSHPSDVERVTPKNK